MFRVAGQNQKLLFFPGLGEALVQSRLIIRIVEQQQYHELRVV